MAVLAEVPVSDIVATIVPDQTRKFSICYPELIDSSQVWCCAQDQSTRDEWLAVQGSWSLETTVLKPLLLGYTLQLLTRYKGDRLDMAAAMRFCQ